MNLVKPGNLVNLVNPGNLVNLGNLVNPEIVTYDTVTIT